jgi:hypothetical protein
MRAASSPKADLDPLSRKFGEVHRFVKPFPILGTVDGIDVSPLDHFRLSISVDRYDALGAITNSRIHSCAKLEPGLLPQFADIEGYLHVGHRNHGASLFTSNDKLRQQEDGVAIRRTFQHNIARGD